MWYRLGLLAVLLAATPSRAEPAQGIRVHMHGAEGYAADGTLYSPKGTPPFAAVVLVPDERGITARLNEAVSRFSEQGFLVVALDLNRGLAPSAASHAEAEALHDLEATLAFVSAQTSVRPNAIGLIGWQSGGAYAMRFAADPRVKAVIVIDAAPIAATAGNDKKQTPILAVFAKGNSQSTQGSSKSFQAQARQQGLQPSVKGFPKAASGFDDPDDTAHYRAADALELGRCESAFFAKHLLP